MTKNLFRKLRGYLFAGGLCFAAWTLSAQEPVSVPPPAEQGPEYPNKASGDNAMKARSYDTAASFYAAYRKEAEKRRDAKAVRDAMECEIIAWILGARPTQAEISVAEYKKKYPKAEKLLIDLWTADILLLKHEPENAKTILLRINPQIPDNDPEKQHALAALATAYQMLKDYKMSARLYGELIQRSGDNAARRLFIERRILMLAESGELAETVELLKNLKMTDNIDQRSIDALRLLNIYLLLKNNESSGVREALKDAMEAETTGSDSFFFLVSSLIGDELFARKEYAPALNAYRLAYLYARTPYSSFDALTRMTAMLEKLEKKEDAAALALTQFDLFRHPAASVDIKLFAAKLFIETGSVKEAMTLFGQVFQNEKLTPEAREGIFRNIFAYLIDRKDFVNAEALAGLYFAAKPECGDAWLCRARIAERKGDAAGAVDFYCKAAAAEKKYFLSATLRAVELSDRLKDYSRVIELAGGILAVEPENPVLFYRAAAYEALKKTFAARMDYHAYAALKNVPPQMRVRAMFREAALLFAESNFPDARKIFRAISRMDKDKVSAADAALAGYWSIYCSYRMQDSESAEQETLELVKRFPESGYAGNALLKLSDFYTNSGNPGKAGKLLDMMMTSTTMPAGLRNSALYRKALLAYQQNDFAAASENLRYIFDSRPGKEDEASACYLQADVLKAQNSFADAIGFYRRAAALQPGTRLAQAALGSEGDCLFAIASSESSTAGFGNALKVYRRLLETEALLPEYELMTRYKTARCLQLLDSYREAALEYRKLIDGISPKRLEDGPEERFWMLKSLNELEWIALKNSDIELIEGTMDVIGRLSASGFLKPENARDRIRALRRHKREMITPGESKK